MEINGIICFIVVIILLLFTLVKYFQNLSKIVYYVILFIIGSFILSVFDKSPSRSLVPLISFIFYILYFIFYILHREFNFKRILRLLLLVVIIPCTILIYFFRTVYNPYKDTTHLEFHFESDMFFSLFLTLLVVAGIDYSFSLLGKNK